MVRQTQQGGLPEALDAMNAEVRRVRAALRELQDERA